MPTPEDGRNAQKREEQLDSPLPKMSRIRTFPFTPAKEQAAPVPSNGPPAPAPDAEEDVAAELPPPSPLTLALARKESSYILVHPTPQSVIAPNERQHAIINALVREDPFPELSESGRPRLWLKVGAGKSGEPGGENEGLLEKLVEAGVVRECVSRDLGRALADLFWLQDGDDSSARPDQLPVG